MNFKHLCLVAVFVLLVGTLSTGVALAQSEAGSETEDVSSTTDMAATTTIESPSATTKTASETAEKIIQEKDAQEATGKDLTQPEQLPEKVAIFSLFEKRPVDKPGVFSFMAYWVQSAVESGVPANTIFLVLVTAFLATFVSFIRIVVGLPTIGLLVPIALAFAFVAVGVLVGLFLLSVLVFASYLSKVILLRLKIMYYPKRSLSIFFITLATLGALSAASATEYTQVLSVSIFPIVILMLLGDDIVSVQLYKSLKETIVIVGTTLFVGLTGFAIATADVIRDTLLLYPELIFLTIPANLLMGRYFGLRAFEFFRFNDLGD